MNLSVNTVWDYSQNGGDSDVLLLEKHPFGDMPVLLKDYQGVPQDCIMDYHQLQNYLSGGNLFFRLPEQAYIYPYGKISSIYVEILEIGEFIGEGGHRSFLPFVEGRDLMILPPKIIENILLGIGKWFKHSIPGFDYELHGHLIHPVNFRVVMNEGGVLGIIMTDISSSVQCMVNILKGEINSLLTNGLGN